MQLQHLGQVPFDIIPYEKIITEQYHAADMMPTAVFTQFHTTQNLSLYTHTSPSPSASVRIEDRNHIKHSK